MPTFRWYRKTYAALFPLEPLRPSEDKYAHLIKHNEYLPGKQVGLGIAVSKVLPKNLLTLGAKPRTEPKACRPPLGGKASDLFGNASPKRYNVFADLFDTV
jgi:hypothetical protein